MPVGPRTGRGSPPSWWDLSLYGFLEDLELEGWVWEFMRRAMLMEMLGNQPVDAMNPNPGVPPSSRIREYYRPGSRPPRFWERLLDVPEAVFPSGHPNARTNFLLDVYETLPSGDTFEHRYEDVTIDLNRRDTVIKRDFARVLKKLRRGNPEPARPEPRKDDWLRNHALEAWDLYQWGVSWANISRLLNLEADPKTYDFHGARQAVGTAQRYINNGGWRSLALYCDIEESW